MRDLVHSFRRTLLRRLQGWVHLSFSASICLKGLVMRDLLCKIGTHAINILNISRFNTTYNVNLKFRNDTSQTLYDGRRPTLPWGLRQQCSSSSSSIWAGASSIFSSSYPLPPPPFFSLSIPRFPLLKREEKKRRRDYFSSRLIIRFPKSGRNYEVNLTGGKLGRNWVYTMFKAIKQGWAKSDAKWRRFFFLLKVAMSVCSYTWICRT